MTLSEFNAWLEGFEEAINGAPSDAQWAKIKARLATVKMPPATIISHPPVITERPVRPYRIWYDINTRGHLRVSQSARLNARRANEAQYETPELAWRAAGRLEARSGS